MKRNHYIFLYISLRRKCDEKMNTFYTQEEVDSLRETSLVFFLSFWENTALLTASSNKTEWNVLWVCRRMMNIRNSKKLTNSTTLFDFSQLFQCVWWRVFCLHFFSSAYRFSLTWLKALAHAKIRENGRELFWEHSRDFPKNSWWCSLQKNNTSLAWFEVEGNQFIHHN